MVASPLPNLPKACFDIGIVDGPGGPAPRGRNRLRAVFLVIGPMAFLGYSPAHAQESIWSGRRWAVTLKHVSMASSTPC